MLQRLVLILALPPLLLPAGLCPCSFFEEEAQSAPPERPCRHSHSHSHSTTPPRETPAPHEPHDHCSNCPSIEPAFVPRGSDAGPSQVETGLAAIVDAPAPLRFLPEPVTLDPEPFFCPLDPPLYLMLRALRN
jgi:hypothetical protein